MGIKKAQYRLRVYQLSDGSIQLVYDEDAAPADPAAKLLVDQDVVEEVTTTPHVSP